MNWTTLPAEIKQIILRLSFEDALAECAAAQFEAEALKHLNDRLQKTIMNFDKHGDCLMPLRHARRHLDPHLKRAQEQSIKLGRQLKDENLQMKDLLRVVILEMRTERCKYRTLRLLLLDTGSMNCASE